MNNGSLKYFDSPPHSYWMASTSETNYPQLTEDITIDTVVIGGGMAGILCAYLLQKEGINTTILEAERIVQGTTAHTTAKITSQHGIIYDKIKKQRGFELAKQYADANEYAIHEIKNIARENQIDCDYIPQSAYIYTQQEKNIKKLENEAKTASELGINASFINKMPLPIPVKAAVRFDGQAQFHPRKFLLPIAEKINGNGVSIYEKSRAVDLEYGDKITITTAEGKKVTANKAIIASHYPFYNKHGMYYSRIYTERTYIIAVTTKEKYPGGMYVNAEDPSRSVRYQPFKNGELILVVGQNHKTGQGSDMAKNYYILRNFADDLFTIEEIHYRWSTQDCMTLDGVPYVGVYQKDMPNLYIATGFEKWGMTNSMVSAAIIKDLITKGESPWQEVYDPSRQNIPGQVKNFIMENVDVAKHLVKGKIAPLSENVKIGKGEGDVFYLNGNRTGVYRDDEGKLHLVNTTCTHMGCELNWNSAEKSWDCPCHGSRFTWSGDILDGPAVQSLTYENDVNTVEKLIKDEF